MTAKKKAAPKKSATAAAAKPNRALFPTPTLTPTPVISARANFPIVGIGASAGGLAAFEAFFSAMPIEGETGAGMAYIIVQHLAPDHKSMLAELIRRYTRMQVLEVENNMVVEPNCVYIIPPGFDMAFLNGALQLLQPDLPRGHRCPVDFFFRSLAHDLHERAMGIVLSGTGSDGTQGIRAIKAEGGMVIAQNVESTQYDGMPRSATNTGLVDFVLPPAEMPAQLIAYVSHAFGLERSVHPSGLRVDEALKKIFVLLRAQVGHDFSQYKPNTIVRRVERRMAVHQIAQVADYVQYLRKNPPELDALFSDLLIGVTNFFRDPESFKALQEEAIVRMLSGKAPGSAVRVWVPGCATGEEAYSIAILLQERMEALKTNFKLTVFATDIDNRAIPQARAGVYPASIAADVSPERLARFFTEQEGPGFFQINKVIRDILVFSVQDVIKDPPFSRLDLISCRNLLIYMGPELHKKLIPLFQYALNPGGILFLGNSESIGDHADLFAPLNRAAKLFQRRDDGAPQRISLPRILPAMARNGTAPRSAEVDAPDTGVQLRVLTERALLQNFAPVGALINERGDILYLHGRTGEYLEPAPGEAGVSLNILKMARQGLRPGLSAALHKAVATGEPVAHGRVPIRTHDDISYVNLEIRPVSSGNPKQPLFLIIFAPALASRTVDASVSSADAPLPAGVDERAKDMNARIAAMTQELRDKDEFLQSTTEQLETSNEELKSANEEMQSINEEMQSTNEELETSKEELQSVNEELSTVNAELQGKLLDLSQANNDMNNLLAGTGVGTIFVNHQLLIQRFTPAITQVINLIAADVGRPVGHIASNLVNYTQLVEDIQLVLDTLVPREIEVETKLGKWFALRIRPYRTLENVIDGAVITFFDITEMKNVREALRETESLRRLAALMTHSRDAILVQDLGGKILSWNPCASRMYGWTEAEALTMNIRELIPKSGRDEALAALREMSRAGELQSYRMDRIAKDGRIVPVSMTASALINDAGDVYAIATTERVAS